MRPRLDAGALRPSRGTGSSLARIFILASHWSSTTQRCAEYPFASSAVVPDAYLLA